MKLLKKIFRFVLLIIVIIVLYLAGVILYGTITEFKPKPETSEQIKIEGVAMKSTSIDSVITLMTWNIGYAGLGKEMDFFYDGGTTVRAPRNILDKDIKGQLELFTANDSIDFFLIQEIDINSKRSYEINQFDSIMHTLKTYSGTYGLNYDVNFVPVPYTNPMGKVYAGLSTFSKYQPIESKRYQYPGKFPWPTRIFFLDRCFLADRYPLSSGKELIIINTHNSAYDKTGEIKNAEMEFLKKYIEEEFKKGNYIIAGGDWNQCPPTFKYDKFKPAGYDEFIPPSMSFDYISDGWIWAYDPDVPTNRHVETALDENTFKTIIVFFLLSPNVELITVKAIDMNFEYSDHQPVVMKVRLK